MPGLAGPDRANGARQDGAAGFCEPTAAEWGNALGALRSQAQEASLLPVARWG